MNHCDHTSCIHSSLLGLRQGVYYGARIRFFHALVMTLLFKQGSMRSKLRIILKLTYEHARNLGAYVFLYKTLVCILTRLH